MSYIRPSTEPVEDLDRIWEHPLLHHNATELARLREVVRPVLF